MGRSPSKNEQAQSESGSRCKITKIASPCSPSKKNHMVLIYSISYTKIPLQICAFSLSAFNTQTPLSLSHSLLSARPQNRPNPTRFCVRAEPTRSGSLSHFCLICGLFFSFDFQIFDSCLFLFRLLFTIRFFYFYFFLIIYMWE